MYSYGHLSIVVLIYNFMYLFFNNKTRVVRRKHNGPISFLSKVGIYSEIRQLIASFSRFVPKFRLFCHVIENLIDKHILILLMILFSRRIFYIFIIAL